MRKSGMWMGYIQTRVTCKVDKCSNLYIVLSGDGYLRWVPFFDYLVNLFLEDWITSHWTEKEDLHVIFYCNNDLIIFSQSWHCVCRLHLFQLGSTLFCRDVWTKIINDYWWHLLLVSNTLDVYWNWNHWFLFSCLMILVCFRIFILSFIKPMTWALYTGSVIIGLGASSKFWFINQHHSLHWTINIFYLIVCNFNLLTKFMFWATCVILTKEIPILNSLF